MSISSIPEKKTSPPELSTTRTLRVSLRNLHNIFAREHPLWIFKAIFLHAAGGLRKDRPPLLFHPVDHPLPNRIQRDQIYDLELVFPGWAEAEVRAFPEGLRRHLSDSSRHFQLKSCGELSSLQPETLQEHWEENLDTNAEELCLDFLTPLAFKGPEPEPDGTIRRLAGPDLERLLDRRTREMGFPPLNEEARKACRELTVLPWHWHPEKHAHKPKSPNGSRMQLLAGMQGPLYIRGDWPVLLPWLSLSSVFHLGNKVGNGCGRFVLSTFRPHYDRKLRRKEIFLKAAEELGDSDDSFIFFSDSLEDPQKMAASLAEKVSSGGWQPAPAHVSRIPKNSGGTRAIVTLTDEDRVVHKVLQRTLEPAAEMTFPAEVIGFRRGHGVSDAHSHVAKALKDGATHVFESDIGAFFDDIPWDGLESCIDRLLSRADVATRQLLSECIRTPAEEGNRGVEREAGVLQGSPVSPLLSNLFMAPFDHAMIATGGHYLRYGDDFILLTRSEDEARSALQTAHREASQLGLTLKEEKTAIRTTSLGFRFLGQDFSADPGEEKIRGSSYKKALFLGGLYSFAGIDGESVVIRRERKIVSQIPLNRLGEVIIQGDHTLSTRLLQVCHRNGIPVSFCSRGGHFIDALVPTGRDWFRHLGEHNRRRNEMTDEDAQTVAAALVRSKLAGYLSWLQHIPGEPVRDVKQSLRASIQKLDQTGTFESVDVIRGMEGAAAAQVFPLINTLAVDRDPAFAATHRKPHEKPDRFNALLDFAYSALFARIHVLVRHRGLSPYAGFLHSPKVPYESLICDLQEPFRARMDRLCTRAIGQKKIQADDFQEKNKKWWLTGKGMGKIMEIFEREMEVTLTGDPESLGNLITAQINAMARWVKEGGIPRIYQPPSIK